MDAKQMKVLLTGTFILTFQYVSTAIRVFEVSDILSGEPIYTENHGIQAAKIVYFTDGNKTVQIIAPHSKRLLFLFEQMFTPSKSNRLEIFDSVRHHGETFPLNLLGTFSGRFVPESSVLTVSNGATLNFTQMPNCSYCGPMRFTLTFSVVHGNGPYCFKDREFECAEGLCLSTVLECDGITNCRKYTDTDSKCSNDEVQVLALVGAALAVVVIVIVIFVVVCCKRKTTQGRIFRQRGPLRYSTNPNRVRYNTRPSNVMIETPPYPGEPPKPPPYSLTDPVKENMEDNVESTEPPPPYTEFPSDEHT